MKTLISIPLIILILFTGISVKFATHYCGGYVAATKVSLTGELASCGMECTEKDYPPTETRLFTHCCDDVVTFYAIDSNYTPSFSVIPSSYQYNFQVFSITGGLPAHSLAIIKSLYTSVSPPDALMSTNVELSDICVFRI